MAHVDFPNPTAFGSSKQAIQGITSHNSFSRRRFPIRSHSTLTSGTNPADNQSEPKSKSKSDLDYWPQESDATKFKTGDDASAISELSSEAIDSILAESSGSTNPTLSDPRPKRPTRDQEDERDVELENQLAKTRAGRGIYGNTAPISPRSSFRTGTDPRASPRDAPRSSKFDIDHKGKRVVEDDWQPPKKEQWQIQKAALKEKFPDGWAPSKRLSPDAIAGIRALHAQMPEKYTTRALGEHFKISPEAIRRILKSKWQPNADEALDREKRWFKRGEKVWGRYAELGVKPPRKWRDQGIGKGKPEWRKRPTWKTEAEKRAEEARSVPTLITTSEPGGSNEIHQEDRDGRTGNKKGDARGSSRFKLPELITTAAPPSESD